DPSHRIHPGQDSSLLPDRTLRCLADRYGRNAMVPGSVPRTNYRTVYGCNSVPALHAGRRTPHLDGLRHSATGHGDIFLLHYARRDLLRLRVSDQPHAAMAAISHLSQPVAIFPRGPARHLPEGRRPRHSLASNDGDACSRCGAAHGCDPSLSQSARLTVRLLEFATENEEA